MSEGQIGRSLRRLEDPRFLTGRGRYVDDIKMSGQAHGVVVRSPHGHAVIEGIVSGISKRCTEDARPTALSSRRWGWCRSGWGSERPATSRTTPRAPLRELSVPDQTRLSIAVD
jgi:hypothetical protein